MGSLGPPQEKDAAPMREKAAGEGRDPSDSPPRVVWTFSMETGGKQIDPF